MKKLLMALLIASPALAQEMPEKKISAITSLKLLEQLKIPALAQDRETDIAFTVLSPRDQLRLSDANHRAGKCGGFEAIEEAPNTTLLAQTAKSEIQSLKNIVLKDRSFKWQNLLGKKSLEKRPEITAALTELKSANIQSNVTWLSSFPDRYNKAANPNVHVVQMEARIKDLMKNYPFPYTLEQVSHRSTRQNSIRLHLEGKTKPSEIIVLGGHLDSINQSWSDTKAPGADDNASGSSSIFEALRVFITKGQPERSVEFFWYAGEESGLLGSAEIAKNYKSLNKDVIAVLQLDMTLFPGDGELVINNVGDFTSQWLRTYLATINDFYIGARLISDDCGYGCSDHASWYRQGYSTLMPFESSTERYNKNIHSTQDVIDSTSNFNHSLAFSKIALVFAMDLGNSDIRAPR